MMKKKIFGTLLAITICCLIVLTASAYPGVPFDGQAAAEGIHVDLALLTANVGISVISDEVDIIGQASTPVETNGDGNGLDVVVNTGVLLGVEVDLVNAGTSKVYDGNPALVTDNDFLINIDDLTSPLATTDLISTTSDSQVTGLTGHSFSRGNVNNTSVLGGIGESPIVTVQDIYNAARTETTAANAVESTAYSALTDVNVQIPYLLNDVEILSVDVLTSTASATNDGTASNAAASSDVEFVNLIIGGVAIPTPTAGDVYTITSGLQDIARVTISPIVTSTATINHSAARAVSLYIEVLAGPLVNTEIFLSSSSAEANSFQGPTGPTSITMLGISSSSSDSAMLPPILMLIAFLGILSIIAIRRTRVEAISNN